VNIKGVFNTSNETRYEKDPPDGTALLNSVNLFLVVFIVYRFLPCVYTQISFLVFSGLSIDFNFYKTFWSLQVNFLFWKHDYLVKEKSVPPRILLPFY
jgi:hypothetical protein